MVKDRKIREKDLKNFKDLSGVSVQEMKIGLWVSENRRLLTRMVTILLILISAFFFVYSSYSYIIYFMSGPIDNQPENQVLSPRNLIKQMQPGQVELFQSGNKYDLALSLKNENDNFWADFDYCFYVNEEKIKCDSSFILPSEEYYLTALGLDLEVGTKISFKIEDIFWSRINRRSIPDWNAYLNERINFQFNDVSFYNSSRSGLSENIRLNRLEFEILNDSPYSYYSVDFDIEFYSGSNLVGVQRYVGKNIETGEKRRASLSWPGDLGSVSEVKIIPRVNIVKDEVYLKYQDLSF
jgi:hypothetical protein